MTTNQTDKHREYMREWRKNNPDKIGEHNEQSRVQRQGKRDVIKAERLAKQAKVCTKCKIEKPFVDFSGNSDNYDGLQTRCRECMRLSDEQKKARNQWYYEVGKEKHKVRRNAASKAWYYMKREDPAFREASNAQSRATYEAGKLACFEHLGNKCCHCPESDLSILQIDHVNGGGCKELRSIKSRGQYFKKVMTTTPGVEYQLLCPTCNWKKRVKNRELPNLRDRQ